MKTTTETKTTESTITTYTCEQCNFTTTYKQHGEEHYGKTHACKETRDLAGKKWFRFENEADFKAFASAGRYRYERWAGPGWYSTTTESDYCMSCYMGEIEKLWHARTFLQDAEDRIKESAQAAKEIRTLLPPDPEAKFCYRCGLELTDPDDINAPGIPCHTFESICISELREKLGITLD